MGLLSKAASWGIEQIKKELIQYHRVQGVLKGIIFEAPEVIEQRGERDPAAVITASFAVTLPLPVFRCLMLLPSSIDTELAAHRISKTLNREALCTFESESPGEVLERLRPYL
ncbi:MAG: hypothetical protein LBD65_01340 [Spirochaetaceae bacterium]|jgi:hypothetical protein|nr:hypothetical protein [Spirochaetaceae bacterium]